MKLVPGRYYAGFSRPFAFLPSDDTIVSKLEELGGTNVRFFKRGGIELPFDPKKVDPNYSDDWDEVLTVEYRGAEKSADIDKLWAWVVRTEIDKPVPKPKAPAAPPATAPARSSSASNNSRLGWLLLFWFLYEASK